MYYMEGGIIIKEERIKLLEEQVIRLTKENEAIAAILNKKVKPVIDAFYWYNDVKEEELNETGVSYFG